MFQNNADALQHLDVDVVFLEDAVHVFARSGDTSCEGSHRYPPVEDVFLYFSSNVDHCVSSVVLCPGGRSGTDGHEKSGKLFDCLPL